MNFTTQSLATQYDELALLRQIKVITASEFKTRVKILVDKQKKNNERNRIAREKREAIREAERQQEIARKLREAEEKRVGKKYMTSLKKSLDKLNSNGKSKNIDLKKIPKGIKIDDVLKLIYEKSHNQKYLMEIGDKILTLNENNRDKFRKAFDENFVSEIETTDSWVGVSNSVGSASSIGLSSVGVGHTNQSWAGAFFKYTHLMDFDLSEFGIYKTTQNLKYNDICLITALKAGGLEDIKIEKLKTIVKDRNIPFSALEKVCEVIESKIIIKKIDAIRHKERNTYGKQFERTFNIGLIDGHYFIIKPVNITSYAIQNYNDINKIKGWNNIFRKKGKYYEKDSKRTIDSFDVVKLLIENKDVLLQLIKFDNSDISSTQYYDKMENTITNLNYDENMCCISVDCSKLDGKDDFQNVFFDFETYLDDDNKHIPYLVCASINGVVDMFSGPYCAFNFLKSLKKNSRLIAHNANYDYRFLIQHLRNINEISRGNHLIGCSGKFFNIDIEIKDSYHLISMPLRKFPQVFKLKSQKEVMPYDLYNKENLEQRFINIDYVLDNYISNKDKEQFLSNIKKWNLQKGDDYDILLYSYKYCMLDCWILEQGYNIFKGWMNTCVNINIDKILTIASLAHRYFVNEGCYEDVYQLSGVPQIFIQGAVVGGRTMCSENKKISIKERINDFDGVSLYPSSMKRMDGFLKGTPKVITNLNYEWIKQQDGYFVDIKINSVGILRKFPLMSFKNKEGIRIFSNDMIDKTMRVDKYTLEDLITFHNITFDVIQGYYFNEGYNKKINDVIDFLFNERLIKKKEKNPVEMIYKLIMNSGYGKSIMKAIDSETKIFDSVKQFNVYLSRNYNWIKEFTKFGDKVKCKTIKPINEHFNIAHIGTMILSMSKRIMNEVMCCAEDNGIELYYQDTDSMHLKDVDISKLSNSFKSKYNRELIGKDLGQFHSDFQMDDCKDIIAIESIFLGKKCYIDKLEGTNVNTGEKEIDYHIRMKGIPSSVITYTSNKLGYNNPFDMYKDLYAGKAIEFDLTNDGSKCNFKMNKDYSVETLEMFRRVIKF